jgi:hypothetical protein
MACDQVEGKGKSLDSRLDFGAVVCLFFAYAKVRRKSERSKESEMQVFEAMERQTHGETDEKKAPS